MPASCSCHSTLHLITECFLYFGVSIYDQKARYRPLSVLDGRKQKRELLAVNIL